MKRNLLFLAVILLGVSLQATAGVTVTESTDTEYLINSGYSQAVAEDVFVQKNRINGKTIEPLYETSQNKFVNCMKKFYAYIDPAQDTPDRVHHDIKLAPSYTDL